MIISSLFSGIGGLELGFHKSSPEIPLYCEIDKSAQHILRQHYPESQIVDDVTSLKNLPPSNIVTAGFPCQDLSQAGKKVGIQGSRSGLVTHLFRLIKSIDKDLDWLIIENVPYMLSLQKGSAMNYLTKTLDEAGFFWAYRTVESRCFGLPQRRPRIILIASKKHDPRHVLLTSSEQPVNIDGIPSDPISDKMYGFYWTEGKRGVGWAKNAVPPIKGGSTIGIPSPPAVWLPETDFFGTITLNDAERLQGFRKNWTKPAELEKIKNSRWRLVGNAVNTRVSKWIAEELLKENNDHSEKFIPYLGGKWPKAAWGGRGKIFTSSATTWPQKIQLTKLSTFLKDDLKPLSLRATKGFYSRALQCSNVVYSNHFLSALETHIKNHEQGQFSTDLI